MKIVAAFDSFKGALTAPEACAAAARGIRRLRPRPAVASCPLSDGGEGFAEAIRLAAKSHAWPLEVSGPLFRRTLARLVSLDGSSTVVVESAQACGLHLLPSADRSPVRTTTLGVGEMIARAAADASHIVVGLGGSSTTDGGMGMLTALGWKFLDRAGRPLSPIGASLARVRRITPGSTLDGIRITAACDVTNPLFGPRGAARVYAPQKGADRREVEQLDRGLRHFAAVCAEFLGRDYSRHPGSGAAGGLGFALLAFLRADFQPGAALAIELSGLRRHLRGADLCFTGEGQTDAQTACGKLPAAVARVCRGAGVPCVCLSGALGTGWRHTYRRGFTGIFSIAQRPQSPEAAIRDTARSLADAAEAVARIAAASRRP